jgi:hypothetical protein
MSDCLFSPSSCVGSLPLQRFSLGIYRITATPQRSIARELRKSLQDEGREA